MSPECDPGTYGAGCEKKCACPKGVSCDHVTGECQRKCPLGRHGENCDQGTRSLKINRLLILSCRAEKKKVYIYFPSDLLQSVRREGLALAASTHVTAPAPPVTRWRESASVHLEHQDNTARAVSTILLLNFMDEFGIFTIQFTLWCFCFNKKN